MARTQADIDSDLRINAMVLAFWKSIEPDTPYSEALIALHQVGEKISRYMREAEKKHKPRRKDESC